MFQKKEVIKNNFLNSDNAILHRRMIEITIHAEDKNGRKNDRSNYIVSCVTLRDN